MEDRILDAVVKITSAYLAGNKVEAKEVPGLIALVRGTLTTVSKESPEDPVKPAVPVRQSVYENYVVCLCCGEKHKMLKRHLSSEHGLTPNQYRDRFGLPASYPLTAPAYAKRRSQIAKQVGLGTKRHRAGKA